MYTKLNASRSYLYNAAQACDAGHASAKDEIGLCLAAAAMTSVNKDKKKMTVLRSMSPPPDMKFKCDPVSSSMLCVISLVGRRTESPLDNLRNLPCMRRLSISIVTTTVEYK